LLVDGEALQERQLCQSGTCIVARRRLAQKAETRGRVLLERV